MYPKGIKMCIALLFDSRDDLSAATMGWPSSEVIEPLINSLQDGVPYFYGFLKIEIEWRSKNPKLAFTFINLLQLR